jgi:hypothetical protein
MQIHDDFLKPSAGTVWRDRLLAAGAAIILGLTLSNVAPADQMSRDAKRQADVKYDQAVRQAKADYKAARAKCGEFSGNQKDVCIKEAKAEQKRAVADARAEKKSASGSAEANEDKREAEYEVAKEKCDSMDGNAKDACEKQAEATYHQ